MFSEDKPRIFTFLIVAEIAMSRVFGKRQSIKSCYEGEERWNKFWKHGDVGVTPTRKNLFEKFKAIKLPKNAKILDVGCGSGTLAKFWKDHGYNVIGLDISYKALAITSRKGIYCVKGDAGNLPFEDNTFDLTYSDGLLEHFFDPKPVLKEIFRVSRNYVLTMVPRNTLTNLIHNIIVRPPKENKRKDSEWISLHKIFDPNNIKYEKVGFGKIPLPPHLLYICVKK